MDVHAQGNLPFSLVVSGSDRDNVVAPEASGYQSRGIFLGFKRTHRSRRLNTKKERPKLEWPWVRISLWPMQGSHFKGNM